MSSIKNMSLYIPHVFANISKDKITEVFERLQLGKVKNIDFINKMGKEQYNSAYIHFEYWYDNTTAHNFQERVSNPNKEARLIYDEPWYWIVLENNANKHVFGDRKPRIDLNFQEEEYTTPVKQMTNKDFSKLFAPKKPQIAPALSNIQIAPALSNIQIAPALSDNLINDEQMMQELEDIMDDEDAHLITIDGRYVQQLENENIIFRRNFSNVKVNLTSVFTEMN